MTSFPHPLVDRHQEIAGSDRFGGEFLADAAQPGAEAGSGGARFQKRRQVLFQRVVVGERIMGGARFEKEIKGIVDGHFDNQFHLDAQFGHFIREHEAGVPVGERVLLPIDEMPAAGDFLRITQDGRAAMRRGAEPDDMRGMRRWAGRRCNGFCDKGRRGWTLVLAVGWMSGSLFPAGIAGRVLLLLLFLLDKIRLALQASMIGHGTLILRRSRPASRQRPTRARGGTASDGSVPGSTSTRSTRLSGSFWKRPSRPVRTPRPKLPTPRSTRASRGARNAIATHAYRGCPRMCGMARMPQTSRGRCRRGATLCRREVRLRIQSMLLQSRRLRAGKVR